MIFETNKEAPHVRLTLDSLAEAAQLENFFASIGNDPKWCAVVQGIPGYGMMLVIAGGCTEFVQKFERQSLENVLHDQVKAIYRTGPSQN